MPKLIDHATRRLELVNAAWDLIASDGVYAATVRLVAERAGVSPGSVRFIFPSQDSLLGAVVSELLSRTRAEADRVAGVYAKPDQIIARLCASLPIHNDQNLLRRVERALRLAVGQIPHLAADLASCRAIRAAECRYVVSTLASGLGVTDQTLEFEVWRTAALMEGLAEQLCSPDGGTSSDQAWTVLQTHLRGVESNWRRAPRRSAQHGSAARDVR